ncbi:hypothetical protein C8N41_1186, partial [Winogradskyella sediminis]
MVVARLLASDFPSENPRAQTSQLSIHKTVVVHLRKMRNTLINRTFNTPLGIISCDLNYTFIELQNSGSYKNGTYEKFKTSAHDIELI